MRLQGTYYNGLINPPGQICKSMEVDSKTEMCTLSPWSSLPSPSFPFALVQDSSFFQAEAILDVHKEASIHLRFSPVHRFFTIKHVR